LLFVSKKIDHGLVLLQENCNAADHITSCSDNNEARMK
jgi:hypothetical protein